MGKFIDRAGETYGRLTVIGQVESDSRGNARWLCSCECGREKVVGACHLKSGDTTSCGCLRRELTGERFTTHGHRRDGRRNRTYACHSAMIQRCENPNQADHPRYGGRGIIVADCIREFEDFVRILGEIPEGMSIDRIDNDGPYTPFNIRFTTPKVQQNNKRNNRQIRHDGREMTVAQWADEVGLRYDTLWNRIKRGWSIERALTTPARSLQTA